MEFGLYHNYGPIWDIKWSPSGMIDEAPENTKDRRLGIVAGASAAGVAVLFALPFPEDIDLETYSNDGCDLYNTACQRIFK